MRLLARFAALILLLAPATAFAQGERIRDFASDVRIARNGDLTVVETIAVVSAGQAIRHGIQRDFPTSYRNRLGQQTHVGFAVQAVTRDGHPEQWARTELANGVRFRIGEADVLLDPGDHTFVITYVTSRQVLYGSDHDELYWNVTGTGWDFPIDRASVRITLPSAAKFGDRAVYTGPQDATAHDAEVSAEAPGVIAFRTTQPLGAREGLTIAAAFPKNVLDAPASGRRLWWWLQDWAALAAALAALAGLFAWQYRAWAKVGRGPRAGIVVPRFTPPDDLSPAALRYVSKMGFDSRAFTAAIVDLAVKRRLHIDKAEGGWLSRDTTTLSRTPGGQAALAPEAAMENALFASGDTIELKQANHSILQAARAALGKELEAAYVGPLFEHHRDWAAVGVLLIPVAITLVAMVALLVGQDAPSAGAFLVPVIGIAAAGAAYLLYRAAIGQKGCILALVWLLVFAAGAVALFATFLTAVFALAQGGLGWPVFVPLAALPVALFAFKWMDAPTAAGRAVMDRIAGFRQYLDITEEARLETLHPPEKTPELFERYLPHAIALGVENHWADKFSGVLAAAETAGTTGSALGWYSGSGNAWDDPGGFASSVGASLNSTVSSASTSPSSSGGGSSGGGSSGGGGGGGGGSGW